MRFNKNGFFLVFLLYGQPLLAALPSDLTLSFVTSAGTNTLALVHAGDSSGRLFLVEQGGLIRIFSNNQLLITPFLNVQSLVETGSEKGLLGMAFHPDYANNGYFYLNYTYDPGPGNDRTRIVRYQVSQNDANVANPLSASILLEIEQDFSNHNGGNLAFGPDGYLYVGMGDGGSGGDPNNRAQDLTSLLGKMLRLDVDSVPAASGDICGLIGNYAIPADNPFQGDDGNNACDEIWSYGFRNPWRYSFDRHLGDLFIGDVGQELWEEINFQSAGSAGGEYYGWSCMEGNHLFNIDRCGITPLTAPILEYDHDEGCSIAGGYRYRGPIPGLYGLYIYGDFCTGVIWIAEYDGVNWSSSVWDNPSQLNITSFGEDEIGNVYALDSSGDVYRFDSITASDCVANNISLNGADSVANEELLYCVGHLEIVVNDFEVASGGEVSLLSPQVMLGAGTSFKQGATVRIAP